ncbi:MAG: FAD-binding oxidoreductase [Spirochaetes bacterium]|nr:FAD-binding oxidoreductase [Spirochaetota bacterium]
MNYREIFKSILPPESIITSNEALINKYGIDKTKNITAHADCVLFPETAGDVSHILEQCSKKKIAVIPRGSGSGVTGGAAAVYGGVILSFEKMNRIIEIDPDNMIAVVEPGVITAEISRAAEKFSLFYPPDPASLEECSIGGNFAENAGGPSAVKYGTTRDYITGIEFVTVDGTIMHHGGKIVKNVTGYDYTSILCGSEGTLAVITKLYLKLIPKPEKSTDILIGFNSMEDAIETVIKIIQQKNNPTAIEFMEKEAIDIVVRNTDLKNFFPSSKAQLIITFDGKNNDNLSLKVNELFDIELISEKNTFIAKTEEEKKSLWQIRRGIKDAIGLTSPVYFAEDTVVPRSEIPSFIKKIKQQLRDHNLHSIFFGHAGDGNVHIDILKDNMDDEKWFKIMPEIRRLIYSIALKHGGVITGEHGIGSLRKNYLSMAMPQEQIDLMKRIKKAFDPDGILNPGKVIDLDV